MLEGVLFQKNKDYYITCMACYVDLAVDITKLPNYTKIKQTFDLANAILKGGIDFGYDRKELMLRKTRGTNLVF